MQKACRWVPGMRSEKASRVLLTKRGKVLTAQWHGSEAHYRWGQGPHFRKVGVTSVAWDNLEEALNMARETSLARSTSQVILSTLFQVFLVWYP